MADKATDLHGEGKPADGLSHVDSSVSLEAVKDVVVTTTPPPRMRGRQLLTEETTLIECTETFGHCYVSIPSNTNPNLSKSQCTVRSPPSAQQCPNGTYFRNNLSRIRSGTGKEIGSIGTDMILRHCARNFLLLSLVFLPPNLGRNHTGRANCQNLCSRRDTSVDQPPL